MKVGIITHTNKKGQVVIPKAIRDKLGITPDIYLHISIENGAIVIRPVKISFSTPKINVIT